MYGVINEIYLRRRHKVLLQKADVKKDNHVYIATLLMNIEALGYTLSKELIEALSYIEQDQLSVFYNEVVFALKKMLGAHVYYQPMYPNFPEQVMEMEESQLYLNAVIHYLSYGQLLPFFTKQKRETIVERKDLKVIELGSGEDFNNIFVGLLNAKSSLSDHDKSDLAWYIAYTGADIGKALPQEFYYKETMAFVLSELLKQDQIKLSHIGVYIKTATDVLRLAVALSEGDISLATNTRFTNFSRKKRRAMLELINNCGNIEEDMLRYKKRWIRLGEKLHPREYQQRYKKAHEAFYKLRNNIKIATFGSTVERAMAKKDLPWLITLLLTRPTEYARKLDYLLREYNNPQMVINNFAQIAKQVSTPVLLQVLAHFKARIEPREKRSFFPKGNVASMYSIDHDLKPITEEECHQVIKLCTEALISYYADKEDLGKVYLDPRLKDYTVPFSQRSSSQSAITYSRGSKIAFEKNMSTLRSFIYWKDGKGGSTDIDLSAVMYDESWNYLEHVSYTNLKSEKYQSCHSGDITSAPHGASEFIDLDINSVLEYGGRYIVISVHSFTGEFFSELPECFVGWMGRESAGSGEIYEPKTVQGKIDLTSDARMMIPIILDLQERKIIFSDITLKSNPRWYNNVEGNKISMVMIGKAITSMVKPNLYDLFYLHTMARGELCHDPQEADTLFSIEEGIKPSDIDTIIADYL